MKLGNTREEMQSNYKYYMEGARKVGKVFMWIFFVFGILLCKGTVSLLEYFVPISELMEKVLPVLIIALYALWGYIEGNIMYFTWTRFGNWCDAITSGEASAFEGILSLIIVPIMFPVAQFFGIYDYIKILIDGKRYGLKKK